MTDDEIDRRVLEMTECDSDKAVEHLVLEILDWGKTPANRRFPLPGAILVGWTSAIISHHPFIRMMLITLNMPELAPNPLTVAARLDPTVRSELKFRSGQPSMTPQARVHPLHQPKGVVWQGTTIAMMRELAEASIRGHLDGPAPKVKETP